MMAIDKSLCWLCGSNNLQLVKNSNYQGVLTSHSFSITDDHYGVTAAIYRCGRCGFLECSKNAEVIQYYEGLVDFDYEQGRKERSLQAQKLLGVAQRLKHSGRLLDIGAGSGMLVEQAVKMGYEAIGVEPSGWLQKIAEQRNIPVYRGTFPHSDVKGLFDVITLIDVIEHVSDPMGLLQRIAEALAPNGVAIIVTPDVGSIAARVLGWRWWHFRLAHIGYFDKRTLRFAMDRIGLQPVLMRRPGWFFTAEYLWARVNRYMPYYLRLALPRSLAGVVIPVNLRDSWLVACRRKTI